MNWKIQLYHKDEALQLSDCVIALECESLKSATSIVQTINAEWEAFRHAWMGSCAPYVTMGRLHNFLELVGVRIIGSESEDAG
ncbi:MAG TPA: hypothetical protein VG816_11930 [Solirubrobacterales bacterium]|nr:hypothetical protein [Solirubrobacterales bacterium]